MEYTLSPSKLNLMEECPRCFWLSVVKKINRPRGPMSSLPIKMDSIIKKYFNKYREKGQLPPIINGMVIGRLPKNMPKTLYFEENGIKFKGLPDEYLELEDGSIVAFDHKTASKVPDKVHTSYQLQLDSYTFLLKTNGYKTKNIAFLAYYFPCECDIHQGLDIQCKILKIKTNAERISKLLEKAVKILSNEMPEPSNDCEYCEWILRLQPNV